MQEKKYLENYDYISRGAGRFVYKISSSTVLEVANGRDGIIQNKVEYSVLKRGSFLNCFPKVFDRAEDFSWIEVEFATPLKDLNEIERLTKISSKDFQSLIALVGDYGSFYELIKHLLKTTQNKSSFERYRKYLNNFFLNKVDEVCKLFHLVPSEVAKRSSLGKSASDKIVFLDLGVLSI